MYPRLSAFDTPYSLFCLHSYLYSTKFYDALNTSYWNKTGVLLLDFNETTHKRFLQILNSRQDLKLFKKVNREEATEISGIPVPYGGLFFKDAGWLNPNGILKHMLNSPRIKLITGEVTKISKTKVFLEHKDYSFDHICLCSSFESNKLINLKGITKKRGQITYLKKDLDLANLKIPICAQGYISPTSEDVLITGSTYSDSDNEDVTLEENLENIERLKLITDQKVKVVDSNFGYRSITQDRLPLLGKSEDIFINISHGSKGTTSAPISAQFISDLIDGSPPVFGKRLIRSLDPERFIKKS
jgi:tRNA 5-methylaminomethyl-2-thiouridine biosynthesis bifunctional protein